MCTIETAALAVLIGCKTCSAVCALCEFHETYIDGAFIAIEDERFETHSGIDLKDCQCDGNLPRFERLLAPEAHHYTASRSK